VLLDAARLLQQWRDCCVGLLLQLLLLLMLLLLGFKFRVPLADRPARKQAHIRYRLRWGLRMQ
jgi:hypothetical protein